MPPQKTSRARRACRAPDCDPQRPRLPLRRASRASASANIDARCRAGPPILPGALRASGVNRVAGNSRSCCIRKACSMRTSRLTTSSRLSAGVAPGRCDDPLVALPEDHRHVAVQCRWPLRPPDAEAGFDLLEAPPVAQAGQDWRSPCSMRTATSTRCIEATRGPNGGGGRR